jgi:phosphate transport system substrate-binding protein
MMRTLLGMVLVLAGLGVASSCVRADDLKGEIKIDGSSTVYLISEAMATHFKKEHANVQVSVGISGTGGGFKKFMAGETDISDASRAIKPAEAEGCKKAGIEYVEFHVAWDGITVVIHPENNWAKKMTVAQLKKIWNPDTPAKQWSDVDPSWPKEEIKLFGPGPDSGTFDYFTEAINGMERVTRKDYEASQNPDVLVKGVAGNKYALGYFGLAYYEDNKDKLAAVAVAAKEGGDYVLPSKETVLKQTYKPLSRPLFIYVKKASFKRPEVQEFVRFYLRRSDLVEQAKYIQTTALQRSSEQDKFEGALKGLK